jgi:hypothetical protein
MFARRIQQQSPAKETSSYLEADTCVMGLYSRKMTINNSLFQSQEEVRQRR